MKHIIMSDKELLYEKVCIAYHKGNIPVSRAAQQASISIRHMHRIYKKWLAGGTPSLCHASRGSQGRTQYDPATKQHILFLFHTQLSNHTISHAVAVLKHQFSLFVSAPTLRKWLGIPQQSQRTPVKRKKRPRMSHFGHMLQCDSSFHQWFGSQHPPCCLIALIDDASSTILLRFAEQEFIRDVLLLLKQWCTSYGIPASLYCDRRNAYVPAPDLSRHIPQVCQRLGVDLINAHSPQAKGRVERLFRTLQSRLCAELSRHAIHSISHANAFLPFFIKQHNTEFALPLDALPSAHVPLVDAASLDTPFAYHTTRVLRNDWTISFRGTALQIVPPPHSVALRPRKALSCHIHLDDSLHLFYNGYSINFTEIPSSYAYQ